MSLQVFIPFKLHASCLYSFIFILYFIEDTNVFRDVSKIDVIKERCSISIRRNYMWR